MSDYDAWDQEFRYSVREYGDNQPWIMAVPMGDTNLPCFEIGDGFFGFDLPDGTDYSEAISIANFLNEKLSSVVYSAEPQVGWRKGRSAVGQEGNVIPFKPK